MSICDAAAVGRTGILAIALRSLRRDRGNGKTWYVIYTRRSLSRALTDYIRIFTRRVHLHHQSGQGGAGAGISQHRFRSHTVATRRPFLVPFLQSKGLATPFHQRCFPDYGVPLRHAARYMSNAGAHGPADSLLTLRHHRSLGDPYPSPT